MTTEILAHKLCCIKECDRKATSNASMCKMHYTRLQRHGDPMCVKLQMKPRGKVTRSQGYTLEERFWSRVDKNGPKQEHMETNCWIWQGSDTHAYGQFTFQGKHHLAHRLAWEMANGQSMQRDLHACHKCDVRLCVRPDHIFPGTPLENMRDMIAKGRSDFHSWRTDERFERQPRGERTNTAKLSEQDIRDIRALYKAGISTKELAEYYPVQRVYIYRILNGTTWKHVTDEP